MDLVKIDVVGLQSRERALDRFADLAARSSRTPVWTVGSAKVASELRSDDRLVAPRAERCTEEDLRIAVGI